MKCIGGTEEDGGVFSTGQESIPTQGFGTVVLNFRDKIRES
jgi:hypothetical protein